MRPSGKSLAQHGVYDRDVATRPRVCSLHSKLPRRFERRVSRLNCLDGSSGRSDPLECHAFHSLAVKVGSSGASPTDLNVPKFELNQGSE